MKQLLTSLILIVSLSSFISHTPVQENINQTTTVYLCYGEYSTKYHFKKDCRGLSNCSTDIEKTTLTEAKKKKRTICGWED